MRSDCLDGRGLPWPGWLLDLSRVKKDPLEGIGATHDDDNKSTAFSARKGGFMPSLQLITVEGAPATPGSTAAVGSE